MIDPVVVISTGVANTASVACALRRSGADVLITDDAERVRDASGVVLPGVGSFSEGMSRLRDAGLDEAIIERVDAQRPLLAVCLGLQLLCVASEESPGVTGLGVIDRVVRRFPTSVRAPQFGWNFVRASEQSALVEPGYAYFANSYRIESLPDGWTVSTASHGSPFVAGFERGAVLACQFHPELSGQWGAGLLRRWLITREAALTC